MKNTKRDKCIENFLLAFSVGFLILWFGSTISILIFSDGLTSNLGYLGFNGFQEIFSFPIKSLVGSTTIFGMYLAYRKFKYQENQLQQTKRLFDASIQPFLSLKSLTNHQIENNEKLSINLEIKNTGNYPATITSILLIITRQNENNAHKLYEDEYIEKKFIIFPDESKKISPEFGKKPDHSVVNDGEKFFEIKINYRGINSEHSTICKYLHKDKKYSEVGCDWISHNEGGYT